MNQLVSSQLVRHMNQLVGWLMIPTVKLLLFVQSITHTYESTAGADALVEGWKLAKM